TRTRDRLRVRVAARCVVGRLRARRCGDDGVRSPPGDRIATSRHRDSRESSNATRMRWHPLVLLVLAACAAGDAAEDLSLPALHAEKDLRVGSVNDPATALTFFRDVAVAPDGRMYTLHRQGSE